MVFWKKKDQTPGKAETYPTETNQLLGAVQPIKTTEIPDLSAYREIAFPARVLATLSQLIPVSVNLAGVLATKSVAQQSQGAYRVILGNHQQLMASKAIAGAFRGATQKHGVGRISGQANWIPIESSTSKLASASASISAAMNVMSIVVGQYYMTQINGQLRAIERAIDEIKQFQNEEFLSKVRSTLRQTKQISSHITEIITSESERTVERARLEQIEAEAGQQLDFVNTLIKTQLTESTKFKTYSDKTMKLASLAATQQALLATLGEISRLMVVLSKGEVSTSRANATYKELSDQTMQVRTELRSWQQEEMEAFHVELKQHRRKRTGVTGLVTPVASRIVSDYGYLDLPEELVSMMEQQIIQDQLELPELAGYEHPVELLFDDDKIYYHIPEDDQI